MAPLAPKQTSPAFGPMDFSPNKKKLVETLTAKSKNDVAAEPKKKSMPAPMAPTAPSSPIIDPTSTLRTALNPTSTIGQDTPAPTQPSAPSTPKIEQNTPNPSTSSISSVFSVPTASASDGLLDTYMKDPSISPQGKKALQDDIESGAIDRDKAEQIITQIYKEKQMSETPTDGSVKQRLQSLGGWINENTPWLGERHSVPTIPKMEVNPEDNQNTLGLAKNIGKVLANIGIGAANIPANTINTAGSTVQEQYEGAKEYIQDVADSGSFAEGANRVAKTIAENPLETALAVEGVRTGIKGAGNTAKAVKQKINDVSGVVRGQRGSVQMGKGYTEGGEEIEIPVKTGIDKVKTKILDPSVENLQKPNPIGETPLNRLASRAVMPSSVGKSGVDLLKNAQKSEAGLKKVWELVRTKKIDGSLDSMPDVAKAIVDGLDKYGKEIGEIRQRTFNDTLDTMDVAQIGEKAVNSDLKNIRSEAGYSRLKDFYDDFISENMGFDKVYETYRNLGNELGKLRKSGDAGTSTYGALRDMHERLGTKIDKYLENESGLTGAELAKYQEAMKNYAALKSISQDFLKSTVVDARRAPMGLAEQMAMVQGGYFDLLTNPVGEGLKLAQRQIAKEIAARNTREGAMKQFFDGLDRIAEKRTPPDVPPAAAPETPSAPSAPSAPGVEATPTIGQAFEKSKKKQ